MKKTYFSPATDVLEIEVKEMILAGSPEGFTNDVDEKDPIDPENMLSRRRNNSVWGDEEELEEEGY